MIIFIYGDDSYRSREKLNNLKEKFRKEIDHSGLNLEKLTGEKLDLETFVKTVFAPAFLAKKRMIIIENFLNQNQNKNLKEEILKLLKIQKDENIVIFYETQNIKKEGSNKLFVWLAKQPYAQKFPFLNTAGLSRWLKNEAIKNNVNFETKTAELLVSFIGNDLWRLSQEFNKLIAYKFNGRSKDNGQITPHLFLNKEGAESNQKKTTTNLPPILITEEDVKLLVKGKINEDIFALTDAVAKKDRKKALRLFHEQISAGLNPLQILTMLIWQFKILLQVKDLIQQQPSARISSRLAIHPYVAQKAILACKIFEFLKLKTIYKKLLEIDYKIKTGTDPVLALDLFISKI